MYTVLNLADWPRRSTYAFFKDYDDPFFNITAPVDVTRLRTHCREEGHSFFLSSLFFAVKAANDLEAFRLRLLGDQVICYDRVQAGSTVLMPDHTFRFCYFDFVPERLDFIREGMQRIARLREHQALDPRDDDQDMIHFSVIPWVSFTSFKHARRKIPGDCIPKIVFGKYYEQGGRLLMPVSVEVHHALMDGYHTGQYFEQFQANLEAV